MMLVPRNTALVAATINMGALPFELGLTGAACARADD